MMTSVPASPELAATAAGAGGAAGGAAFGVSALGAGGAGEGSAGAEATALPASPSTATTVLICTMEPSGTLISVSTPLEGEGISASTLSVEISKRGSSF